MEQGEVQQTILLVDDEQDFARGLQRLIVRKFPNMEVLLAHTGNGALDVLKSTHVDIMLTDMLMPGMTGMELLPLALELRPDLSMVMLTAHGTIETAVQAVKYGAYDFLTKPVEPSELFRVVAKSQERAALMNENRLLKEQVRSFSTSDELIGESPAMQQLKLSIQAVAHSDYTVLVRGESGTGKEMVARMIHQLSTRNEKTFLSVNCPAIPEQLLESELFGHVKGAFTGADKDHKGLFATTDGGTLHLDEIGDISFQVQTKLLRVLQEGEVRPVGANHNEHVNVRVVASTNQELEKHIQDKSFREDLYYRLNVLTVTIPPLRERVTDIPLLTYHFLRQSCTEMGLPEKGIAPDVLTYLSTKQWQGNVRELQNYVRRLTVFCSGETVDMNVVRLVDSGTLTAVAAPESDSSGITQYKEAKNKVIDDFTQAYVSDLLKSTKGNISEAARVSGLSRVALQKILARLNMDAASFR
ncbi:sigma-54 dependent transcriptional regulator [Halodesulfovibrio sp.]|jgi:DNA-binding NtrC family response regulator|uniref:sigma-54-dependent transcriptional regulator n=1 Tax=Halodesulfovibrio sp. TaxID=1912772 RepID=UPI0025D2857D|nr:sigma-54 dependent transcriptional regulator [Halodesulfovibrio sp.]MCT4535269.1 sigma-54 dependent transcriptional regulator [Halodesulfovibrio sp.]